MENISFALKGTQITGKFIKKNNTVTFVEDINGNFIRLYISETLEDVPQIPLFFDYHSQFPQKVKDSHH